MKQSQILIVKIQAKREMIMVLLKDIEGDLLILEKLAGSTTKSSVKENDKP